MNLIPYSRYACTVFNCEKKKPFLREFLDEPDYPLDIRVGPRAPCSPCTSPLGADTAFQGFSPYPEVTPPPGSGFPVNPVDMYKGLFTVLYFFNCLFIYLFFFMSTGFGGVGYCHANV